MNNKRTVILSFSCKALLMKCEETIVVATAKFDANISKVEIRPSASGNKLYSDSRWGINLAVTKYIPKGILTPETRNRKVKVVFDPTAFGLSVEETIEDADGRLLFRELVKHGFKEYPERATCNNGMGDLVMIKDDAVYSFHITKTLGSPPPTNSDLRLHARYRIIGKLLYQCYIANKRLGACSIAILHSELKRNNVITPQVINLFNHLNICLFFTSFEVNWWRGIATGIVAMSGGAVRPAGGVSSSGAGIEPATPRCLTSSRGSALTTANKVMSLVL